MLPHQLRRLKIAPASVFASLDELVRHGSTIDLHGFLAGRPIL
jgi:hypothetical protein